jgi:hypothetical protein
MTKKINTMKVSGGDYAKVKDRMKEFRQENPRGLVETTPTVTGDSIIFKARILKDKEDPNSAEATGHSMGKGTGAKVFEKQETIAVGRALAFLGYGADGEIASSEEMEEFEEYQQQQFLESVTDFGEQIEATKTLDELKEVWTKCNAPLQKALYDLKERKKKELSKK